MVKEDVRLKYILGNETMELAEQLGNDLFDTYIVNQIDLIDEEMDKLNLAEDLVTYTNLNNKKQILEDVREAYLNLKK